MKRLIATIHPFVYNQEIQIYEDDKCIQVIECPLQDLEDTIYNLCKKQKITDVDLFGGQLYALKIQEHFASKEFAFNKINVTIH